MGYTAAVESFIRIDFTYAAFTELRGRITVGDYMGWTGVPIVGGVDTNVGGANISSTSALKVRSFIDGTNSITVVWDAVTYGNPWTSGTNLSTHAAVAGSVSVRERRFEYDASHDTFQGAWDGLLELCATARAVPIRDGGRIRIRYSGARNPIDIVTQSSIVEGSFQVEYGGAKDRPNVISIDFIDRDLNYERSPASLPDPSVQLSTSLEPQRRESKFVRGVTRRTQVFRQMAYELNIHQKIKRGGKFQLAADALAYEAGDVVVLSHDLTGWGVSGRMVGADDTTTLRFDREIILVAATTYKVKVRNPATGQHEERTVSSAAGTYAAGDAVLVSSAFTFTPPQYAPFVVAVDGTDILAEIVSVSLTRDLRREVQWVQYDATVYTDNWFGTISQTPDSNAAANVATQPKNVDLLAVAEVAREGLGGSRYTEADLTWRHPEATFGQVGQTIVWQRTSTTAEWQEAARVSGLGSRSMIRLRDGNPGAQIYFAVQPVSSSGAAYAPSQCTQVALTIRGIGPSPEAPTGLSVAQIGGEAIYSWTRPNVDRGLKYEARRGGWILGQPVFANADGDEHGPTRNWSSGVANAGGVTDPVTYLRAVSPAGQWSAHSLVTFTPSAAGFVTLGNTDFESKAWEDYGGTGLWHAGSAPDTTLTDLQVTGGILEFAGSALTGSFTTAIPLFSSDGTKAIPRWCMVEAHAVAQQVHPLTLAGFPLPIGHPEMKRWTLEGPLYIATGETGNCTLGIAVSYQETPGAAYTAFRRFTPGLYKVVAAQFKITVTRPATTYQVRISRFATRIRRLIRQNEERTALERYLQNTLFRA
jgi:hypothetical protein